MAGFRAHFRDWAFLAAYVALIYGTLSIAPKFSRFFSKLLGHNFGIFVDALIILAVAALVAASYKALASRPAAVYAALAAILSLYAAMIFRWTKIPSEKLHLIEYGFLSYLVLRVVRHVRGRWARYLYVLIAVVVVGCCDELIQKCLPNRVCEAKDMVLNVISGVLGLALIEVLFWHPAKLGQQKKVRQ